MDIEMVLRIFLGGILGGIIGLERKHRFKQAGFKTHFLVGLGSSLIMIVSQYGFEATNAQIDPTRIAAQVVSGIGFLGAGTIMVNKESVTGLTTAAGLWVTAAIGLALGSGMYSIAIITTGLVIIGLEVFSMEAAFSRDKIVEIFVVSHADILPLITNEEYLKKIKILSYQYKSQTEDMLNYELRLAVKVGKHLDLGQLIKDIGHLEGVQTVKVEML